MGSSQSHASNHSQQTEQSSSSNCPEGFGQELQKRYPVHSDGTQQTSQPTDCFSPHMSPTRRTTITAFEKNHPSSLVACEKFLPAAFKQKRSYYSTIYSGGPSTNPEHPLSLLWGNSFQPQLNISKGFILDISNISEKQILQTPAHGNLNHRVENPTFHPITPH